MLVLGIETSCDETAAAILDDTGEVLSNVILSQIKLHEKYGGVVPEIACRKHIEVIDLVVEEAVKSAGIDKKDIGLVAVTVGPGLVGALLVGATFARGFAMGLGIPLIGVNHLEGHLFAGQMEHKELRFPYISLIVSGGHTSLVKALGLGHYEVLGRTLDDAAGEAFDKVAKMMDLGYPGGPIIEKMALNGIKKAYKFPRPMINDSSFDFSFSGLKTAVLYQLKGYGGAVAAPLKTDEKTVSDLAASFQEAVVDVLLDKAKKAMKYCGLETLSIGGGVGANGRLREVFSDAAEKEGWKCFLPSRNLCTDNAVMIAGIGRARFMEKKDMLKKIDVNPRLPL
ncbi:MAG: tRNA (adenosine(37)-N6)-threonylcarbamoyltransferase complex transferase subunit TsaD [Candidatus Theseobacter exili]|nr:tRNA (adenosine(37)-N6)-threonylcarbamoyltransferase complex transferase subunit TsaD [Candidatus Theseobacter exili]